MHRGTGSLLCLSFSFESLQGAFADDSSKGDAEHCLGLSIPLSFLTPHLVLTSRALAVAQPPPVPGQGGSCALLPPQLGQLLPAVSLLA